MMKNVDEKMRSVERKIVFVKKNVGEKNEKAFNRRKPKCWTNS